MASELRRWQEIADRGIQDSLPPEEKEMFDEAVKRQIITIIKPEYPGPMVRLGRGMKDVYQGAQQNYYRGTGQFDKAQEYTDQVNEEIGHYQAGRDEHNPGEFDWTRLAGNVATPLMALPAAAPTVGGQMVLGAASGAFQGSQMFNESNSVPEQIQNTAIGGFLGGILGPAVPAAIKTAVTAVKKTGNYLAKALRGSGEFDMKQIVVELQVALKQAGIDWNQVPKEAQDVMVNDARMQLQQVGETTPEQIMNKADIEAVAGEGNAMNAQVTRNPYDWSAQENLQKQEVNMPGAGQTEAEGLETITMRKAQQDAAMVQYADDITEEIYKGAEVGTRSESTYQSSEKIKEKVIERASELQEVVSKAYQIAQRTVGSQANLNKDKFAARVGQTLEDFDDIIPGPIKKKLADYGIIRMDVTEGTKAFTVKEGDALAKLINRRETANIDPEVKEALRQLRYALHQTFKDLGEGGNEAAKKFKIAWGEAAKRFDEIEAKDIKSLLSNKADTARFIESRIIGGNPKEINSLKSSVMAVEGGEAVWDDMVAQVWKKIVSKANSGGDVAFSGKKLSNELDKIGIDRLRILFPDQVDKIMQLMRGAKNMTMEVPGSAVNYSNTSSVGLGSMLRLLRGAKGVPFADQAASRADAAGKQKLMGKMLRGDIVNTGKRDFMQSQNTDALVKELMKGFRGAAPLGGASATTQPQ